MRVGIQQKEENHAEGHQVHEEKQDDSAVIPAPARVHATQMIDGPSNGCERGQHEERSSAVVRKIREEERQPQAEEDQEASTKKGAIARIENTREHSTASRVEGFRSGCENRQERNETGKISLL